MLTLTCVIKSLRFEICSSSSSFLDSTWSTENWWPHQEIHLFSSHEISIFSLKEVAQKKKEITKGIKGFGSSKMQPCDIICNDLKMSYQRIIRLHILKKPLTCTTLCALTLKTVSTQLFFGTIHHLFLWTLFCIVIVSHWPRSESLSKLAQHIQRNSWMNAGG